MVKSFCLLLSNTPCGSPYGRQLNGDCPRRDAHSIQERCNLICPDLPKVL